MTALCCVGECVCVCVCVCVCCSVISKSNITCLGDQLLSEIQKLKIDVSTSPKLPPPPTEAAPPPPSHKAPPPPPAAPTMPKSAPASSAAAPAPKSQSLADQIKVGRSLKVV